MFEGPDVRCCSFLQPTAPSATKVPRADPLGESCGKRPAAQFPRSPSDSGLRLFLVTVRRDVKAEHHAAMGVFGDVVVRHPPPRARGQPAA
jgi:hypothetical protein